VLKSLYSKSILNNSLLICTLCLLLLTGLNSCTDTTTPKPRGYFRIALPEHQYQNYQTDSPISLDIPAYSKVELHAKQDPETYKFNVYLPRYKARIHCTYVPVNQGLDKLLEDAYQFAYKHEVKALAINKTRVDNPSNRVFGMRYDLIGNVASPIQFFATDSTNHFFRGSLYFSHIPNADSLQPVIAFVKEDINHMLQSINWGE
jgi:gliding motility-associated lipoprotein GldD